MIRIANKASIQSLSHCCFIHGIGADKHNLLATITPDWIEIGLHALHPAGMIGPAVLGNRRPPKPTLLRTNLSTRLRQLADEVRPCCKPEEALRPDDARSRVVAERLEARRMKWTTRSIHE